MKDAVLIMNLAAEQAMNVIIKRLKEAAKIHTGEAIMKNITINIDGKEIKAQVSEEDIKKLTQEPEWPQDGDEYWYISTLTGPKASEGMWEDHSFYHGLLEVGNCYRTEQEAKDALRAQKLIAAVAKRRKELNGEWKPNWSRGDKKYFIEYRKEYLYVNHFLSICSVSPFGYFKSSCRAVAIIDEYEDELLWYFTEYLPSIN